ncbi:tim-barrel domain-containing protein [Aspergillus alliaceus]|uniref:tim-barrel domain-containing protein n=1 Tax=Petromyces alliaceus TaxID=209559 RepID=UPI0012A433DA|nr:tim-barrel domain-containing protein [Aspergillus alliaceus]KAB8236602.1 tim-barrel domain-containing protein [Aspergillus alliaceus]
MLILDLFSKSEPQWQRTKSYFGKPWIGCQLHGFGRNMGLYGQIMNVTLSLIDALESPDSLVGFRLTMEGQEENEIIYDLLLVQAWSAEPIEIKAYFENGVSGRYAGNHSVPRELYTAWDMMRTTAYHNTNLTTRAVAKPIFELSPDIKGLLYRAGNHGTTMNYDDSILIKVWSLFMDERKKELILWMNPAYQYDMLDITRQLLGNAFTAAYSDLMQS